MRESIHSRPPVKAFWRGLTVLAAAIAAHGPAASAQQTEPAKEARGKWVPVFQRHADEYLIAVGADGKGQARRLPEPVLRWWQPVRGGDDGALHLWMAEGRPVAAVAFFTFKWPDGNRAVVHEYHSLAQVPVGASWRGQTRWSTAQPGVTFGPIPDAEAPAATSPVRLRQMQAILREVSAHTVDDKGSTWPLRPLTTPLHRYRASDRSVLDGALFALVQGTDPEALLLIEARAAGATTRWYSAVARFTDLEIAVRHRGREIFSGPHTTGRPGEVYLAQTVLLKPSDTPEDFDAP